jgi:hypothetical protein
MRAQSPPQYSQPLPLPLPQQQGETGAARVRLQPQERHATAAHLPRRQTLLHSHSHMRHCSRVQRRCSRAQQRSRTVWAVPDTAHLKPANQRDIDT